MKVEIWSDVVCPWCYIGKRRFEKALAAFAPRDQVEVTWRSFELDPTSPKSVEGSLAERLAAKYGMTVERAQAMQAEITRTAAAEGLEFRFDRARPGNTFDSHRLLHLAAETGKQDELKERLLHAYFTDGEPIGDHDTLIRLAAEVGIAADHAAAVLSADTYAAEVRTDETRASRLGISGVPFFVLDEKYGLSGAQPTGVIGEVLQKAWEESHPLLTLTAPAAACAGDNCVI